MTKESKNLLLIKIPGIAIGLAKHPVCSSYCGLLTCVKNEECKLGDTYFDSNSLRYKLSGA